MQSDISTRMWDRWERRFSRDYHKYITPNDRLVEHSAGVIDVDSNDPIGTKARETWLYVNDTISYKLSRRWKKPRQTIYHRSGDCEDITFLMASLLPNVGVHSSEIVIGVLETPYGRREEHAWNRVEGKTIDATTSPRIAADMTYHERSSWTLKV